MENDIYGNPDNRDVHGNISGSDAWGNPPDTNVYGNPPADVHGNYSPGDGGDGGSFLGSLWDLFG